MIKRDRVIKDCTRPFVAKALANLKQKSYRGFSRMHADQNEFDICLEMTV